MGYAAGDPISFGGRIWSATGVDHVRWTLQCYDATDTLIATLLGSTVVGATLAAPGTSYVEAETIPANYSYGIPAIENIDDTEVAEGDQFTAYKGVIFYGTSNTVADETLTATSGNTLQVDTTPAGNVSATIGSSADANGNYLQTGSTSAMTDDAGLSQTAAYGGVTNIPAGVQSAATAGVVQQDLGSATGSAQVLTRSYGGSPAWADKYGTEINVGGTSTLSVDTGVGTAWGDIGSTIRIPNPGQYVELVTWGDASATTLGTTDPRVDIRLAVSFDGGSTWTAGNLGTTRVTTANDAHPLSMAETHISGTPTGDIQIKMQAEATDTSATLQQFSQKIMFIIAPRSDFSLVAGTLTDTLPSTESPSAYATYPTTTATTSVSLSGVVSGGTGPFSYSNTRTGGTGSGTITSGATAQTFTVSSSGTATDGGSSVTDTYKQTVTDSLSNTANSSCTVTSTFYQQYAAISASMSATNGSCTTGSSAGTCSASGTFSVTANYGNGSYVYSNTITSQTSGYSATITSGATAASGTYSGSHLSAPIPGNKDTVHFQTSVNDTRGTGAQTATATGTLTYRYTV